MILDKHKAIINKHTNDFKELFESKVFEGNFKRFVYARPGYRSDFPILNIASDNFYIYQKYLTFAFLTLIISIISNSINSSLCSCKCKFLRTKNPFWTENH